MDRTVFIAISKDSQHLFEISGFKKFKSRFDSVEALPITFYQPVAMKSQAQYLITDDSSIRLSNVEDAYDNGMLA